jgi:hypothetical protein
MLLISCININSKTLKVQGLLAKEHYRTTKIKCNDYQEVENYKQIRKQKAKEEQMFKNEYQSRELDK